MSDLDDIISIQLTRGSQAVTTASFSVPMVLSTHTAFADRSRTYSTLAGVGGDFATTSNVYKIANQLFGQSSVGASPSKIVVGRRQVDMVTVSVPTVSNNTAYSLIVNGTTYTVTSSGSATATSIVTLLVAALGTIAGLTIVNAGATFTIAATVPGVGFQVKAVTINLAIANTTVTETWSAALDAVELDDATWYTLVADTQVLAEQEELSDAMAARRKIMGLSTADPVAITTGTTDIGYKLSAKAASRTFGVYSATAATEFPEAAWIGAQLAYTPGSNDWDFKRGVGVTASKLTPTQQVNLRAKGYNFNNVRGGVAVFQDGNMFNATSTVAGTPIDEIIVADWLYARLQEGIYFRIINSLKIPMTNPGLLIIENEIRAVLSQAEANGAIDRGWTVSTPDVLSIPANLRAQRIAGVFKFNARSAGSIRKVNIEGFLVV